jgi:uncharacterized protein YecE (DUF72 family)
LKRDDALLSRFLDELPSRPDLRWAMEFRNDSWKASEVETLLRSRNVAWAAVDTEEGDAERRDTADFVYARLRKNEYPEDRLASWGAFLSAELRAGKDCYVYCKHQDAEAPWKWADRLRELVGI